MKKDKTAHERSFDPAFAVIEYHRICFAKMDRAIHEDAQSLEAQEAMAREADARRRLISCRPTTLVGLKELVDYVLHFENCIAEDWEPGEAQTLLQVVASYLKFELSPLAK